MGRARLQSGCRSYLTMAPRSYSDIFVQHPFRRCRLSLGGCNSRRDNLALPFSRHHNILLKPLNIKHSTNPKTIGEHLRKRRYDLALTQAQVATIIGVTEDSITYWENERSIPQVQFYGKIIKFLGYNPFEFEIKTFGDKIKHYRYLNGLSQKALGKLLGIDPSTLASWENNLSVPKRRKKNKVEEILKAGVQQTY